MSGRDQLIQPRFFYWRAAFIYRSHLCFADIDAQHVVPLLRHAACRRRADIAEAKYRDFQNCRSATGNQQVPLNRRPLIRFVVPQHAQGFHDNGNITPKTPVAQIFQIGLQPLFQIAFMIGGTTMSTNLR